MMELLTVEDRLRHERDQSNPRCRRSGGRGQHEAFAVTYEALMARRSWRRTAGAGTIPQ